MTSSPPGCGSAVASRGGAFDDPRLNRRPPRQRERRSCGHRSSARTMVRAPVSRLATVALARSQDEEMRLAIWPRTPRFPVCRRLPHRRRSPRDKTSSPDSSLHAIGQHASKRFVPNACAAGVPLGDDAKLQFLICQMLDCREHLRSVNGGHRPRLMTSERGSARGRRSRTAARVPGPASGARRDPRRGCGRCRSRWAPR
jgi:hypothetical protein